ncbi:MAG: hypothetical protein WA063_01560 [Minisyncoccia bacterium]
MNYASQKLTKGMFRKIEIKNGFSMIVADYKRNGSSVLITPFDPNFFHDEGEYLFIEPTNEDLQKSPIKISLFGEIYPVHCLEIKEEILAGKKISVHKSSFFLRPCELKENPHDIVVLFRSYKENNYCLIEIQSENKRSDLFRLIEKRYSDYTVEYDHNKKNITVSAPKLFDKHHVFYNEIINCIRIILEQHKR